MFEIPNNVFLLLSTNATDSSVDQSDGDSIKFSSLLTEAELAQGDNDEETKAKAPPDPIKWFGILTPPALKTAQNDFKEAVSCVPSLASIASNMKQTEIEIRRTRKKLTKLT